MSALAAVWLIGLLCAAPALRSSERYTTADRLRDALILGVAIPGGLALAGCLYPALCWIALAMLAGVAYVRERARGAATPEPAPYVLIAVLALVAWPPLMRPLLDGDSLAYHLPNAAAWANAHSYWVAQTRYWWYPPASELFASGLFAVSGPFALGWSGFFAIALIGFRIHGWCLERIGTSLALADAIAAATISMAPFALQAGSLQNDVWLAALLLETVCSAGDRAAGLRSAFVAALVKPYGWLLALFAFPALNARVVAVVASVAIVLLHALALDSRATITVAATSVPDPWGTTILAHGPAGLWLLAQVFVRAGIVVSLAYVAALFAPLLGRDERALRWYGTVCAALYLVLPFGYSSGVPQLANGASLRFATPALAIGMLVLARFAKRDPTPVLATILAAYALVSAGFVASIFWNDASTHSVVAVVALALAVYFAATRMRVRPAIALALGCAILAASHFASTHPSGYYADATAVNGARSGVFAWIARERPARIGVLGLRSGIVNVLDPSAAVADLPDEAPCDTARDRGMLLLAYTDPDADTSSARNARRRAAAKLCGPARYNDPIATIVTPR